MASSARRQAELDAEARLSAKYGLGDCTGSWAETSYLGRVIFGWILLAISAIAPFG